MIFLGVDGGATKTEFFIADHYGKRLASYITKGCNFHSVGIKGITEIFSYALSSIYDQYGISTDQITRTAIGLPVYEENVNASRQIDKCMFEIFKDKVDIYNDAVIGLAGSLAGEPGINVISGTGSICYGNDGKVSARSGGWSGVLCDEGSCHWIGRKTIEVFTKQSDGRLAKTHLYNIIKKYFELEKDLDFTQIINMDLYSSRDKVAALQKLTLSALQLEDSNAKHIYEGAIAELIQMVSAVYNRLHFKDKALVSYSGGLFKSEEICQLFSEMVPSSQFILKKPAFSPAIGALIKAAQFHLSQDEMDDYLSQVGDTAI